MDLTLEDLRHRLDQLRLLASETDDPLAERLVRDMIAKLEDRLMAEGSNAPASPSVGSKGGAVGNERRCARVDSVLPATPLIRPEENLPRTPGAILVSST
jgi:hypothetical protein